MVKNIPLNRSSLAELQLSLPELAAHQADRAEQPGSQQEQAGWLRVIAGGGGSVINIWGSLPGYSSWDEHYVIREVAGEQGGGGSGFSC